MTVEPNVTSVAAGSGLHDAAGEPSDVGAPPVSTGGSESRREARLARRRRRQLAVVCALFVTVCLVLTLLIVELARSRPGAPGTSAPTVGAGAAVVAGREPAVHPVTEGPLSIHPPSDSGA